MKESNHPALLVSRGDNPWNGMTSSYEQEEANRLIGAMDLRALDFSPFNHLIAYDDPDPLLVRLNPISKVVINKDYFSALRKTDGTDTRTGGKQVIGNFLDITFSRLSPRQLALFLIESQIIQTYWHVEAELSLYSEEETEDIYSARFTGQHIFFTNERNTSPLDFTVRIDKKNGEMAVMNFAGESVQK